jgi:ketosteroid isomerase-like protein
VNDQSNSNIVQGTYEAIGRGDIPALLVLLADEVTWTLQGPSAIPFAGTRHGREGVAEFFTLIGETLDFQKFEPREFISQGESVVVLGYEHSIVKPTGRELRQEWAHVYTVRDGKIATFRAFEDSAALTAAFTNA